MKGMRVWLAVLFVAVFATHRLTAAVQTNAIASSGSTLPNGVDQAALINSVGSGDDIALPADPTTLAAIVQAVDAPATLAVGDKTLAVGELAIQSGGAALTVGTAAGTGTVVPIAGALPGVISPSEPISALAPIIWYDPSDAATVTLDGSGGVTRLANKAATGSNFDAAVPAGHTAPLLATGTDSFGPLPMLRSDKEKQSLRSMFATGITGNAPRTLIAVLAHNEGANTGVSFGNSYTRQLFEVVARTENTMFGTYTYDIYNSPAPAAGELKLLTFIAESGTPNPLSTFVDGTAGNTSSGMLNTVDTPLCLGQRANQNLSWRGQVGEVILFDYALSAAQRIAVESYLLAKWKHGLPTTGYPLTLRNDSAAPLTLNTTLNDPTEDTSTTLFKNGAGRAVLAGPLNHTGANVLNDGALVIDTPDAADTTTLAGNLIGGGTLVKTGPGLLHLAGAAETFYGDVAVSGGVARVSGKFGKPAAIEVTPGTALEIASPTANAIRIAAHVTVSGAGTDGNGAIRGGSDVTDQMNAFTDATILLADDTTVNAQAQRWDIRNSVLDMNGHVLTKTGGNWVCLPGATTISNAPVGTAINIQGGAINLESNGRFHPADATRVIDIGATGILSMFCLAQPMPWAINAADGATIRNGMLDGTFNNASPLDGPVSLAGTLNLVATWNSSKSIQGQLSGEGSLVVSNNGTQAFSFLTHSNNTYTGMTTVNNATLGLRYPGSLPNADYTRLTITNNGGVIALAGADAEDGFTPEQVRDLLESGRFTLTNDVRAGVDTSLADMAYPYDILPPFAGRLVKFGPGTLTLDGHADLLGDLYVWGGNLAVTNAVTLNFNERNFYFRPTPQVPSLGNHFGGRARIVATDRGYATSQPTLTVGQAGNAKAVLTLDGDAFVSARLLVGGGTSGDGSAVGAVYHAGNAVWVNTGGRHTDGAVGNYGYGYYQLDGGALTNKGFTSLGAAGGYTSAIGVFYQNGGAFVMNGGLRPLPAAGEIGESYDGFLKVGASRGAGILHLAGGSFLHHGNLHLASNSGDSTAHSGVGIVSVEDTADAVVNGNVVMGQRHSSFSSLNLNDGRFAANAITRATGTNAQTFVQYNGGTFVANASGPMFQGANDTYPMALIAHGGGAIIEVPADTTALFNLPLGTATGKVLSAVSVTKGGTGYIAPPIVTLTGGDGTGATAIAEIDRDTGAIIAVRVTAGGTGYTSAPSVAFTGGGGSGASASATVSEPPADGGLKKTGPGTLCLTAASTYAGPTEVMEGELRLTATNALPADAVIRIAGGTLRCASVLPQPRIWYDPADAATVTLDQSGNVTRLANKGYSGAMHDAVPDKFAPPRLATGATSHAAHPMIDTVSGTTGLLSLNNTGISGTAPRSLVAVISRNDGKGCTVSQFPIVSAPRAAFEILARATENTRFGTFNEDVDFPGVQTPATPYVCTFVSAVDGLPTQLATFRDGVVGPVKTIAIDTIDGRLGFNNRNGAALGNYAGQIGEVMLFDVSLTADQRTVIENYLIVKWKNGMNVTLQDFISTIDPLPDSTIELAGGTLDLSEQTATTLTLIGNGGSVSNGTLAAGTVLSPGGDDAVGTLALADVGLNGAEYRLSFDGPQADLITSEGTLDMTGLTVTALTEPSGKSYPILHAAEGLTGTQPNLVGLPSKWYLRLTADTVYLVKQVGTCITIR